jgi:hypothetical protein
MYDLFQNLEVRASQCEPALLIILGIVGVLLGLCLWLGGLQYRKIFVAFMGAIAGGAAGEMLIQRGLLITAIAVAAGALIAFLLERIFITLLSTTMASGLLILVVKNYRGEEKLNLDDLISSMQQFDLVMMIVISIVLFSIGIFLWRFAAALFYSTLGTGFVFAGMISLLSFKGSLPITAITNSERFYLLVLGSMIVFGAIVQLLFAQKNKPQPEPVEEKNN